MNSWPSVPPPLFAEPRPYADRSRMLQVTNSSSPLGVPPDSGPSNTDVSTIQFGGGGGAGGGGEGEGGEGEGGGGEGGGGEGGGGEGGGGGGEGGGVEPRRPRRESRRG